MRTGALSLVLLGAAGCTTVWTIEPPAPPSPEEPVPLERRCGHPAEALERELAARLAAVDEALGQIDEVALADEAAKLREERLLLMTELQQLGAAFDPERCAEADGRPALDRATLESLARERVASARAQADRDHDGVQDPWGPGQDFTGAMDGDGGYFDPPSASPPPPPAQPSTGKLAEKPYKEEAVEELEEDEEGQRWPRPGWTAGGERAPAAAAVVAEADQPVDLMPALRRQTGPLRACLSPVDRQTGISLQVVARLRSDGSLEVLQLTSPSGLTAVARDCLVAALGPVRVSPPGGQSRILTVPLTLTGD